MLLDTRHFPVADCNFGLASPVVSVDPLALLFCRWRSSSKVIDAQSRFQVAPTLLLHHDEGGQRQRDGVNELQRSDVEVCS